MSSPSPSERYFREQFEVNFLATWAAIHYDEYCATGQRRALNHPPVEDAEYLAKKAWDEREIYRDRIP